MLDTLLIQPGDNLMSRLTAISGNVDMDKLTPSIWTAQITDIQRILTKPLYDKILTDFDNNNLSGEYLKIFEDYVSQMLIFYATSDFIMKNTIMIANGGNFIHTPENSTIPDFKQTDRISKHYRDLGAHFELDFYEYMKSKSIPEYKRRCVDTDSFNFPWQL